MTEMTPVESSSIEAVGYDESTHWLDVRFNGGRTYRYFDVPLPVYQDLMAASSKGNYVNTGIKPNYRYSELPED